MGARRCAFERGDFTAGASQQTTVFGTIDPNGTNETTDPYRNSMVNGPTSDSGGYSRMDALGDKVTWGNFHDSFGSLTWNPESVGVTGTSAEGILAQNPPSGLDARQVAFGDPAGDSYLYTDLGDLYQVP